MTSENGKRDTARAAASMDPHWIYDTNTKAYSLLPLPLPQGGRLGTMPIFHTAAQFSKPKAAGIKPLPELS